MVCHVPIEQAFNLIFGYNDRYAENLGGTKSGAGTYVGTSTAVPAGEVWVVNFAFVRNNTRAGCTGIIVFNDGTDDYFAAYQTALAQLQPALWNGQIALKEGDTVIVRCSACQDADVITAGVWGYKMVLVQ